jgi:hypothetical protein
MCVEFHKLESSHYDANVGDLSIVEKAMAGELSSTMQSRSSATATDIDASKDSLLLRNKTMPLRLCTRR